MLDARREIAWSIVLTCDAVSAYCSATNEDGLTSLEQMRHVEQYRGSHLAASKFMRLGHDLLSNSRPCSARKTAILDFRDKLMEVLGITLLDSNCHGSDHQRVAGNISQCHCIALVAEQSTDEFDISLVAIDENFSNSFSESVRVQPLDRNFIIKLCQENIYQPRRGIFNLPIAFVCLEKIRADNLRVRCLSLSVALNYFSDELREWECLCITMVVWVFLRLPASDVNPVVTDFVLEDVRVAKSGELGFPCAGNQRKQNKYGVPDSVHCFVVTATPRSNIECPSVINPSFYGRFHHLSPINGDAQHRFSVRWITIFINGSFVLSVFIFQHKVFGFEELW